MRLRAFRKRQAPARIRRWGRLQPQAGACIPDAFREWRARNLFQRGVDRGEFGAELGAQSIHNRDDGKGNAGRNQAILDGRGGSFVFQEFFDDDHAGSRPVILSKQTVLDR